MHGKLLKGKTQDVIDANIRTLKDSGYEHGRAVRTALCCANKNHKHDAKRIAKKVVKKSDKLVVL